MSLSLCWVGGASGCIFLLEVAVLSCDHACVRSLPCKNYLGTFYCFNQQFMNIYWTVPFICATVISICYISILLFIILKNYMNSFNLLYLSPYYSFWTTIEQLLNSFHWLKNYELKNKVNLWRKYFGKKIKNKLSSSYIWTANQGNYNYLKCVSI